MSQAAGKSAIGNIEDLTLNVTQEIHVNAALEVTFAALLEQLGPQNEVGVEKRMPMTLEPWPGGRWYRDLGDQNGHCWGFVQAIKRPTLLEISGPLMMSAPATNNVQYRLSQVDGGTLIKFRHAGFGLIIEEHRAGVGGGWTYIHAAVKARAEATELQATAAR